MINAMRGFSLFAASGVSDGPQPAVNIVSPNMQQHAIVRPVFHRFDIGFSFRPSDVVNLPARRPTKQI